MHCCNYQPENIYTTDTLTRTYINSHTHIHKLTHAHCSIFLLDTADVTHCSPLSPHSPLVALRMFQTFPSEHLPSFHSLSRSLSLSPSSPSLSLSLSLSVIFLSAPPGHVPLAALRHEKVSLIQLFPHICLLRLNLYSTAPYLYSVENM